MSKNTQTYKVEVAAAAYSDLRKLVAADDSKFQWVRVALDASIVISEVEGYGEGLYLMAILPQGIVMSSDSDTTFYDGPADAYAYRPMFIPWAHVYGITVYRDT